MTHTCGNRGNAAAQEARRARLADAVAMRAKGLTAAQIGEHLKVSATTIRVYLSEDKLLKRSPLEQKDARKTFKRSCMSCGRKIVVDSPYLWRCGSCKEMARGAML